MLVGQMEDYADAKEIAACWAEASEMAQTGTF
jgi:hypothetical protein